MVIDIVKIFLPSVSAFIVGILITPAITNYLYSHKMWKKKAGKEAGLGGGGTPIFNELHKEREVNTPRMGGIVIWASAIITIIGIWLISNIFPTETFLKLDFLSRNQTWIPLFTLFFGSLVGLIDDWLEVSGKGNYIAGGLSLKHRLGAIVALSLFVAVWFFSKLEISSIGLPEVLGNNLELGWLFVPFFVLVALAIYSGGVIDGIDGLAGGIFTIMFSAYGIIAFYQNQINLAAFSATIAGAILAFLWFNIPPARYYMSETGTMGLTITLTVVAFMTDTLGGGYGIIVLPIIAMPLLLTTLSNIIQVTSKKLRGKKVFSVAPIHHHFEAMGWPAYKVTMRYWVFGVIFSMIGVILALIG